MRNEISPELIERYLKGECTPEEGRMVQAWYDSFDEDTFPEFMEDEGLWETTEKRLLDNIKTKAGIDDGESSPEKRGSRNTLLSVIALSLAACLSVIYLVTSKTGTAEKSAWNQIRIANHSRQIKKYVFSDSSVAWLKPSTVLYIGKSFNQEDRVVKLVGEAFFEVFHNPAKPFVVRAGSINTKVLGTRFSVQSRPGAVTAEVVVASGKVQVNYEGCRDAKSLTLLADQSALVNTINHTLVKGGDFADKVALWKKRDLWFDNVSVKEVVKKLNENFKINIYYRQEEIGRYQLRADFSNANLPDVLAMLEKSLNVSYEVEDTGIKLQIRKHEQVPIN